MIEPKEITLTKLRISMTKMLSEYIMEPKVEFRETLIDAVRMEISGYLLGEKINEVTVRYPADWWQAFKVRWFTYGMRKRWPVRYKKHVIVNNAMYPDIKLALPDERVVFTQYEWTDYD